MIHAGNPVSLVYIIFIFALFWESRVEFASASSSDYSGWNSKRSVRWKSLFADAGVHLCQFLRCHCRQIISKFLHIVENEPSAVAVHCKVRSAWQSGSDASRMSVECLWNGMGWNNWPLFSLGLSVSGYEMRQAGLGRTGTLIGLYVWFHSWTALTLGGNAGRRCPTNRVIATKLQQSERLFLDCCPKRFDLSFCGRTSLRCTELYCKLLQQSGTFRLALVECANRIDQWCSNM